MPKKDSRILAAGITLNGETYDLPLNDVLEVYILEDIYSFCVTGKMILIDREGIFELGPFTGTKDDGITVLYSTDDDTSGVELKFKIFKIEKSENAFPNKFGTSNILHIIFVDELFFKLTRHKWSRSFREKTIGEIIEHLCMNMLEIELDLFIPPEQFMDLWYIPRWDAATCLKWLMERSSVGDDLSYLFYSNTKDGKINYNCLSFNELLKSAPIIEVDGDGGEYIFDAENQYKGSKIKNWSISSIDESALKNLQGSFGFGYDFEKKKLIDSHDPIAPVIGDTPGNMFYTYKDMLEKHVTVLGEKSLFHDISDPEAKFINYGESDPDIIKNMMGSDFVKRYNMQQLLTIDVFGHQDRYAGAMINIIWPSFITAEKFNKNLKGLYLIKSVTHSFQPRNTQCYTQRLVCIKNGYYDSDCGVLEDAVLIRSDKASNTGSTSPISSLVPFQLDNIKEVKDKINDMTDIDKIKEAKDKIKDVTDNITNDITDINKITDVVKDTAMTALDMYIQSYTMGLLNLNDVSNLIDNNPLTQSIQNQSSVLDSYNDFNNISKNILNNNILPSIDNVKSLLQNTPNLSDQLSSFNNIQNLTNSFNMLNNISNGISDYSSIMSNVSNIYNQINNTFNDNIPSFNNMNNVTNNIINNIIEPNTDTIHSLKNMIDNNTNILNSNVEFINNYKNTIYSNVDNIKKSIDNSQNVIENKIKDVVK